MLVFSSISLKWRLLFAGMLCALLAALSGTAGIFSLRWIQNAMQETSEEINSNLESQKSHIRQLTDLRSLVTRIFKAKSSDALMDIEDQYAQVDQDWNIAGQDKNIMTTVTNIWGQKNEHLAAQSNLDSLSKDIINKLDEITAGALNIEDNIGFDSELNVDEAHLMIANKFHKMTRSTEEAFCAVTAALSLQGSCHLIYSKIKNAQFAKDPAIISFMESEIQIELNNISECLKGAQILLERHIASMMFHQKSLLSQTEPPPDTTENMPPDMIEINRIFSVIMACIETIQGDTVFNSTLQLETGIANINRSLKNVTQTTSATLTSLSAALNLRFYCEVLKSFVHKILSSQDIYVTNVFETSINTAIENIRRQLKLLEKTGSKDDVQPLLITLDHINQFKTDLTAAKNKSLIADSNLKSVFNLITDQIRKADTKMIARANSLKNKTQQVLDSSKRLVSKWENIEILLGIAAFISAIIIGIVISRSVTNQLDLLNSGIQIVGEGNL